MKTATPPDPAAKDGDAALLEVETLTATIGPVGPAGGDGEEEEEHDGDTRAEAPVVSLVDEPVGMGGGTAALRVAAAGSTAIAIASPITLFTGGPVTLKNAIPLVRTDAASIRHGPRGGARAPPSVLPEDRMAAHKKHRLEALKRGAVIKLRSTVNQAEAVHSSGAADGAEAKEMGSSATAGPRHSNHGAKQHPGTRVTLAPSAILAAHTTDPSEWILAIRKSTSRGGGVGENALEKLPDSHAATTTTQRSMESSLTQTASTMPALEEKLTLADLQRLMYGFASQVAVSDHELMERIAQETKVSRGAASSVRREAKQARKGQFQQSSAPAEANGTDGGHAAAANPSRKVSSKTEDAGTQDAAARQPPQQHQQQQQQQQQQPALDKPLPSTAEGLTSLLLSTPTGEHGGHRESPWLPQPKEVDSSQGSSKVARSAAGTTAVSFEKRAEASTASKKNAKAISFERVLNEEEFIALMHEVLAANPAHQRPPSEHPGASPTTAPTTVQDEEIRHLLNKVDYEGHGSVTWNELATFFISQSRHRSQLSQLNVQYNERPEPAMYASVLERHQRSITCYTSDAGRKIIITGSMDGTVRAWSIRSLTHRGLVFVCPDAGWVVGVHYGFLGRLLFVVTMDRKVYVLDGASFEVLRTFQGRAVDDSGASVVYAHDTTRMVRVGGVVPPPPCSIDKNAPSVDEQKFQQQQRYLRKRAEGMGGFASLQAGHDPLQRVSAAAAVMTTALAFETLDLDNTQVTTCGSGPYIERRVAEDVIVGLVDAITATTFHYSALDEETLLLGTTSGDVHLVVMPPKATQKVLVPKHSFHRLHSDRVNKLEVVPAMDALMSCAEDGKLILTSLVTGRPLRVFHAPDFPGQHVAIRDFAVNAPLRMAVTVGPERSGLVWDFAQSHPVAVLDAHNCSCHCCTIVAPADTLLAANAEAAAVLPPAHILTAGADGSIQVFDMNGFHRMQTMNASANAKGGTRGSGGGQVDFSEPNTNSSSNSNGHVAATADNSNADHVPHLLIAEVRRRSVLCFSRYMYRLQMKRQVTTTCPARYCGHTSPMLSVLYTRSFDMFVTVDADSIAMTWHRPSGENVFAFSLGDFSDSATMNATRLSVVALDGMQRRMLTGFRNGAVVVWNVVNGQAINFITAGMPDELATATHQHGGGAAADAAAAAEGRVKDADRPWRQALRQKQTVGTTRTPRKDRAAGGDPASTADASAGEAGGGGGGVGVSGMSREVTAVTSLIRHNAVFIVFAIRGTVFVVPEDPTTFTIATMYNSWTLPLVYGEVSALMQMTPQLMACGTTSGALLFLHVLSGKQEGAALWVKDASSFLALPGATAASAAVGSPTGHSNRAHGSSSIPRNSTFNGDGDVPTAVSPAYTRMGNGTMGANNGNPLAATVPTSLSRAATATPGFNGTVNQLRSIGLGPSYPQQRQQAKCEHSASALSPEAGVATIPNSSLLNPSVLTSRIVKLMAMAHIHPHLLLAVHMDGTVALWHALRRVYLGSVCLAAAHRGHGGAVANSARSSRRNSSAFLGASPSCNGEEPNNDDDDNDAPTMIVDVNLSNDTLVFVDERGSVHVCEIGFHALEVGSSEEQRALSMPNPAWYTWTVNAASSQEGGGSDGSLNAKGDAAGGPLPESVLAAVTTTEEPPVDPSSSSSTHSADHNTNDKGSTPTKKTNVLDAERGIFVFERFARVHVFPSGLTAINGILVVDPKSKTDDAPADGGVGGGKVPRKERPLVMCCSGESQYSRVFTLDGLPVGEPGMDPWDLKDKHSYRYMGEPVIPPVETAVRDPLPDNAASKDADPNERGDGHDEVEEEDDDDDKEEEESRVHYGSEFFFDYLAESYAVYQQQQQQLFTMSMRRVGPGRSVGGRTRRSSVTMGASYSGASTQMQGAPPPPPPPPPPTATATALLPDTAKEGGTTAAAAAAAAAAVETTTTTTTTTAVPAPSSPGVPLAVPMKQLYNVGVRHLAAGAVPETTGEGGATPGEAPPHVISTLMTKNTKDTHTYGRVLKPTYAYQIRNERRLRKQQEQGSAGTSHNGTVTASHSHDDQSRTRSSGFALDFISLHGSEEEDDEDEDEAGEGGEGRSRLQSQDVHSRAAAHNTCAAERGGRFSTVPSLTPTRLSKREDPSQRTEEESVLSCRRLNSSSSGAGLHREASANLQSSHTRRKQPTLPAILQRSSPSPPPHIEAATVSVRCGSAEERGAAVLVVAPKRATATPTSTLHHSGGGGGNQGLADGARSMSSAGVSVTVPPTHAPLTSTCVPDEAPKPTLSPSKRQPSPVTAEALSSSSSSSSNKGELAVISGPASPTATAPSQLGPPPPAASGVASRKAKLRYHSTLTGLAATTRRKPSITIDAGKDPYGGGGGTTGKAKDGGVRSTSLQQSTYSPDRVSSVSEATNSTTAAMAETPKRLQVPIRKGSTGAPGAAVGPRFSMLGSGMLPDTDAVSSSVDGGEGGGGGGGGGGRRTSRTSAMEQQRMIENLLEVKRAEVLRNLGGPAAVATTCDADLLVTPPRKGKKAKAPADGTAPPSAPKRGGGEALGGGAGVPATNGMTARSFIAAVSARMYVAPVEEVEPPVGSRSRGEAKAWRDHLKRLQEGKSEATSRTSKPSQKR